METAYNDGRLTVLSYTLVFINTNICILLLELVKTQSNVVLLFIAVLCISF